MLCHVCLILELLFCWGSLYGTFSFHCIDPVSDSVDSAVFWEGENIDLIYTVTSYKEIVDIPSVPRNTVFYWEKLSKGIIGRCSLNSFAICVRKIDANYDMSITLRKDYLKTRGFFPEVSYSAIHNITLNILYSNSEDSDTYSLKIEGKNCTLFSKTVIVMDQGPICSTFYQSEYHAVEAICTWRSRNAKHERARLVSAGMILYAYENEGKMPTENAKINKISAFLTFDDVFSAKRIPVTCEVIRFGQKQTCNFSSLILNGVYKITDELTILAIKCDVCASSNYSTPAEWWVIGYNTSTPIRQNEQTICFRY